MFISDQQKMKLIILGILLFGLVFYGMLYRLEMKIETFQLNKRLKFEREAKVTFMKWFNPKMSTDIYILSAYYDDRPTLDPRTNPAVRIIGIADKIKIESLGEKLYCIVWQNTSPRESVHVEMVATHIGIGEFCQGKYYRQYIFVCPLTNVTIATPSFISVIDSSYHRQFDWKVSAHIFPRIPVKYPEKPTEMMDFGQCTSITYWTIDPFRIVEWVELHRIWGVSEMNVYGSMVGEITAKVFKHYHEEGFLRYTAIDRPVDEASESVFFLMASPVINDCIYRNMYKYKKIVVVDLDEMIVPRGNLSNYPQLLNAIETSEESKFPYRMYNFRNLYFFFELQQNEKFPTQLRTLRQVGRLRDVTPFGAATKSIIDPMACTNMHNHYCWRLTERCESFFHSIDVQPSLGLNHHYKNCHFDKYMLDYDLPPCKEALKNSTVDYTMLHYKHQILSHVKSQWDKLGFSVK